MRARRFSLLLATRCADVAHFSGLFDRSGDLVGFLSAHDGIFIVDDETGNTGNAHLLGRCYFGCHGIPILIGCQ